jgi:RimJ/RimL family protein N-acetyltransferase
MAIPLTRIQAPPAQQEAIRAALRDARGIEALPGRREVLAARHIPALYDLIADPRVSDPIYVFERPITLASTARWVLGLIQARARGEGLTLVNLDEHGAVSGFTELVVWPHWAAAEIGGALRADRQGRGEGPAGFATMTRWLFDAAGVELICLTAALDNMRSQRMIDGLGFIRRGEVDSQRPDGTLRRSVCWELTREEWGAANR